MLFQREKSLWESSRLIMTSMRGVEEMCFVPREFHLNVNFLSGGIGKILLHYGY